MCGVVAVVRAAGARVSAAAVRAANLAAAHRGPDGDGEAFLRAAGGAWQAVDPGGDWQVALGHRRLKIVDLSENGRQPMAYGSHLATTYNGEIYNYVELRAELARAGHEFRSTSDTEVALAAYAEWGPACFARFRGMWGLALVDAMREQVVLSRDRLGIKPLYLWKGDGFVAAVSEIKQLLHFPGFAARADAAAAAEYLGTGYEDPRRSFFADVVPVRPGALVRIALDTLRVGTPEDFWHPERVGEEVTDPDEAARRFAARLRDSVRIHLRSDVPVGCALSGGLDSGAIAAIATDERGAGADPLRTFTSSFPGEAIDERPQVQELVARLGAAPAFVTPTAAGFLADLRDFVWHHDEPVGSLSIYASFCVARITRAAGVPVTLNGQGGDEILGGYWQSYFVHLRDLAAARQVSRLAGHLFGALGGGGNRQLLAQAPAMFRRWRARRRPEGVVRVRGAGDGSPVLDAVLALEPRARRLHEIRWLFLPRLLRWDDRSSMAFAVEGRYPMLDHELIELCLSFAPETLYDKGWTKQPLRRGLASLLPASLLARRTKLGFETPQEAWLRGPLRPALESWLAGDRALWKLVDAAEARRVAAAAWGGDDGAAAALFRLFAFDRWADRFEVALS